MKVLFVCSGNICRSPMAAEYFRTRAARSGLSHVVVDSAGTLDLRGAGASPEALGVMKEIGIDLSRHRSKQLNASDLRSSDLVFVMSHNHLEHLARRFPEGTDQRMLLRAFEQGTQPDSGAGDIDDPVGQPIEFYRKLLPLITRCVDHLIIHLKHPS